LSRSLFCGLFPCYSCSVVGVWEGHVTLCTLRRWHTNCMRAILLSRVDTADGVLDIKHSGLECNEASDTLHQDFSA
jgi:hypothetical protein